MRSITIQASGLILFKSMRDQGQVRKLCQQINPVMWRQLLSAYTDCVSKPYRYFIIDLHVETSDRLRYRSGLTPDEERLVYVLDV